MNQKWERYEQGLLAVLGFTEFPPPGAAWSYQMLLMPTFHQSSCVRIVREAADTYLAIAVLEANYEQQALFEAVWQQPLGVPVASEWTKKGACFEELVLLDQSHQHAWRDVLRTTQPHELGDIGIGSRDGVLVLVECFDRRTEQRFHAHSPQASAYPRHWQLLTALLDLTHSAQHSADIAAYLTALRRYFPEQS